MMDNEKDISRIQKEYHKNRIDTKLPCVLKGRCMECGAPNCSRRVTMIMRSGTGGSIRDRIHVAFVNEDLGI